MLIQDYNLLTLCLCREIVKLWWLQSVRYSSGGEVAKENHLEWTKFPLKIWGRGWGKKLKWRMSQIGSRHYFYIQNIQLRDVWLWIVHCSSFSLGYCQLQNFGYTSREWAKMICTKFYPMIKNSGEKKKTSWKIGENLTAPGFPLWSWAWVSVSVEFPLGSKLAFQPRCIPDSLFLE